MEAIDPLTQRFCEQHPADAAQLLATLPQPSIGALLQALPLQTAAQVFSRLPPSVTRQQLITLPAARAAGLLDHLEALQGARLLHQLDEARRAELLAELPAHKARQLGEITEQAEPTVATLVDSRPLTLGSELSVGEALDALEASGRRGPGEVFVLDAQHRLTGSVTAQMLLGEKRQRPLARIMRKHFPTLAGDTPLRAAEEHAVWQSFCVAPVVDRQGRFLGTLPNWTLRSHAQHNAATPAGSDLLSSVLSIAEGYWGATHGVLELIAAAKHRPRKY